MEEERLALEAKVAEMARKGSEGGIGAKIGKVLARYNTKTWVGQSIDALKAIYEDAVAVQEGPDGVMSKIAIVTDPHLKCEGNKRDEGTGLNARFLDRVKSLEWAVNDARERGCEYLLFRGRPLRQLQARAFRDHGRNPRPRRQGRHEADRH